VSDSGDGKAWGTAFKRIQEGINAASDGDTVMVAEGSYVENIQFNGKNIVLRSTDPLDSDLVANTIIDGNRAGCVVSFSGTENERCILSGFTIRNGESWGSGGGIWGSFFSRSTRARIENNVIAGNSGNPVGGGLWKCNGTIRNCTIRGNSAAYGGGLWKCNGTIQNCSIAGNSTTSAGGGLYGCNGRIENCIISGNSTSWSGSGGGLYKCNGAIRNCTITGNSTTINGGGLSSCSGMIQNCTISGNLPVKYGGGLYGCNGTIENCTISGNLNQKYGGGLYGCNGTIRNCSITGNWTLTNGGGLHSCTGTIVNCIIWGNRGPQYPQLVASSAPPYSCIQDWDWAAVGEGNIADAPRFLRSGYWDDAGTPFDRKDDVWVEGDYRLLPGSPCIDAGKN